MPRKNQHPRAGRRRHNQPLGETEPMRQPTPDELARSLVRRGLRSSVILGPLPSVPRRPETSEF
jgi:hypothetical protein